MKTIAIDFDGVLSAYTGWKGEKHLDPPLPGAIEALRGYLEHYQVVIFTTRAATGEQRTALYEWLVRAGFSAEELSNLLRVGALTLSDTKPPAWLYIDDRAWLFIGSNWPTIKEIENFRTYWEQSDSSTAPC